MAFEMVALGIWLKSSGYRLTESAEGLRPRPF